MTKVSTKYYELQSALGAKCRTGGNLDFPKVKQALNYYEYKRLLKKSQQSLPQTKGECLLKPSWQKGQLA